jgi:hypothetical protein
MTEAEGAGSTLLSLRFALVLAFAFARFVPRGRVVAVVEGGDEIEVEGICVTVGGELELVEGAAGAAAWGFASTGASWGAVAISAEAV